MCPPFRELYPVGDISAVIYITGPIQRLGHVILASDIISIRPAVPGTSGISDNGSDKDDDETFGEQIRSQYIRL